MVSSGPSVESGAEKRGSEAEGRCGRAGCIVETDGCLRRKRRRVSIYILTHGYVHCFHEAERVGICSSPACLHLRIACCEPSCVFCAPTRDDMEMEIRPDHVYVLGVLFLNVVVLAAGTFTPPCHGDAQRSTLNAQRHSEQLANWNPPEQCLCRLRQTIKDLGRHPRALRPTLPEARAWRLVTCYVHM